jgi:hypothetical protein
MTIADQNRNPTAFTTAIAVQAGLVLGMDYAIGTPFGGSFFTARLLGDPVVITIRVIHALGFQTATGALRWTYIGMPAFVWNALTWAMMRDVIGYMYQREGGTLMKSLFPNYGTI